MIYMETYVMETSRRNYALSNPLPITLARWESKSGKHWVNLGANGDGSYFYNAPGMNGSLGMLNNDSAAIDSFSVRVATGIFQPDANTTPMHRVI
jgi:hypothetical protein